MQRNPGFRRFIVMDESDAPALVERMTKRELPVDGERYGVVSRLIARRDATVVDLAAAAVQKLCDQLGVAPTSLAGMVLSSRIYDVEHAAAAVGDRLNLAGETDGIERACSGFPRQAIRDQGTSQLSDLDSEQSVKAQTDPIQKRRYDPRSHRAKLRTFVLSARCGPTVAGSDGGSLSGAGPGSLSAKPSDARPRSSTNTRTS